MYVRDVRPSMSARVQWGVGGGAAARARCCAWPRRACARCTQGKRAPASPAPPEPPLAHGVPSALTGAAWCARVNHMRGPLAARRSARPHGVAPVVGGAAVKRGSRSAPPVRRLAGCRALASACRVRGGPRRSPLGLLPPPHLHLAATGSAAGLAPTPGPATPPPLSLSLSDAGRTATSTSCVQAAPWTKGAET
jgi:hypothetical protein